MINSSKSLDINQPLELCFVSVGVLYLLYHIAFIVDSKQNPFLIRYIEKCLESWLNNNNNDTLFRSNADYRIYAAQ